jgi:geranylgeranylglycerol-phosphate geranylgeranyltransferase
MRTLLAFFQITRPLNVAVAGASIWVAAALATPVEAQPFRLTFAMAAAVLSGMLITAAANTINDLCDIAIDRINRPERVLPSGRLTPKTALAFAIFLFACGNFFSILISPVALLIAAGSSTLVIVYSRWLKRQPLSGNLAVSMVTALAFIYGALAAEVDLSARSATLAGVNSMKEMVTSSWNKGWRADVFPALFSFFFHFDREVIKDIEDQVDDKAVQARTLPLAYGLPVAQAASLAFVILIFATLAPFYFGIYGATYLSIVIFGVDLVLIAVIYFLERSGTLHATAQRHAQSGHADRIGSNLFWQIAMEKDKRDKKQMSTNK